MKAILDLQKMAAPQDAAAAAAEWSTFSGCCNGSTQSSSNCCN